MKSESQPGRDFARAFFRARASRLALIVVALLLPAVAASGQDPQRPVFRTLIDRVRVDVIVTDDDGDFVGGLTADDFTVWEDGEPRPVLQVQVVELEADAAPAGDGVVDVSVGAGPGGANAAGDAPETRPTGGAAHGAERPPRPLDLDLVPPRVRRVDTAPGAVVYVIDFHGMSYRDQQLFARDWDSVLDRTADLGVPHAVYLIDNVGRLQELSPLTEDVDSLRTVPSEVAGSGLPGGEAVSGAMTGLHDGAGAASAGVSAGEAIAAAAAGAAEERRVSFEQRARSLYVYEVLESVAAAMEARAGRTSIIWVSTGVSTGGFSPWPDVLARQDEFHTAANSANVSVYSVDPRPMVRRIGAGVDLGVQTAPTSGGRPVGPQPRAGSVMEEVATSMVAAAHATGGRPYLGWADLGEVMDEIRDDASRYYLLTYEAVPPSGDGLYHEIRVEVDRPDVDVRARRGYVDYTPEDRRVNAISSALTLPGTSTDLAVGLEAFRNYPASGQPRVTLGVSVPRSELVSFVDADGASTVDVEVHGRIFPEGSEDEFRSFEETLTVPRGDPRGLLSYIHEAPLPEGSYDIRVAVLDRTSGLVGGSRLELEIEAPGEGLRASDLVLVEVGIDGPERPLIGARTTPGKPLVAYLEVTGGTMPLLRPRLVDAATGQALGHFDPTTDIAMTPQGGLHRTTIRLPTLGPGTYVLEMTVDDPGTGEVLELERRFTIPGELIFE